MLSMMIPFQKQTHFEMNEPTKESVFFSLKFSQKGNIVVVFVVGVVVGVEKKVKALN